MALNICNTLTYGSGNGLPFVLRESTNVAAPLGG
jgi:hypothetical protein